MNLFTEANSLALASFYAGLLGVPDHWIQDSWSFTVLSCENFIHPWTGFLWPL